MGRNHVTTTQSSLVPAVLAPDFDSFTARQATAGYRDATRDAYSLDLRQLLG
jgi:hypothetical protein